MVRRNAMQVPARRVDAEALPMPDLGFGELVPDTFVTSASVQRPQPYMINHSGTYIEDVRRENCLEKVMLALPTPEAILSWNPNVTLPAGCSIRHSRLSFPGLQTQYSDRKS